MFEELLASSKSRLVGVDTYLTFDENKFGRVAVTRLNPASHTARTGSITVIHGPPGVGKTHLALWSLKELLNRLPRLNFACATTKDLCQMLELATENRSLAEFLEQICSLDVLVCEDLDWLERAQSSQPAFVMLIEALEESSTQLLITSQRPVGEIRALDQRLISRCHGGLCVSMPLPGLESRTQMTLNWFREFKLPILKPFYASARFLAERLPVSPRELRRAITDLAAKQSRKPAPIDVAYLERWLTKEKRAPQLSVETIVLQVAQEFGVDPQELRSHSRQQTLTIPRNCAIWLTRELTGQPLGQIGHYFDRSHTTISHSLLRIKESLKAFPTLRQQIHKLRQQLNELPREDCA